MSETDKPVRFGVAGMGGYAQTIIKALLSEKPAAKLVAACDPLEANRTTHGPVLGDAGVTVLADFDALLAQPIDAVWMPLPIDLHRRFVERAFAAGKAVVCEKPIAGSIDDADAMIAARDRAARPGLIGFQHVYSPRLQALKRELVQGRIGTLKTITIEALWPRDSRYYGRSGWAAKYKRGDVWVMDSPAMNALAHPIHACLYLAGRSLAGSAVAHSVRAELYRANPIENYDTIALRAALCEDVTLMVLLTHAVAQSQGPVIDLRGSEGAVRIHQDKRIELLDAGGTIVESRPLDPSVPHMVRGVCRYLNGAHDQIVGTFEMAREHVRLLNAASEATAVHTVPGEFVEVVRAADGGVLHAIRGIKEVFHRCAGDGILPSQSGLAPWSRPAGGMDLTHYAHFAGPKT